MEVESGLKEWDIESEFVKFNDPTCIHPWRRLTDKICTELTHETFRKLIFLSKDALDKDYEEIIKDPEHSHYRFFEALEKKYNDNVAVYLKHLFRTEETHASSGLINIAEKIEEYIAIEMKYRTKTQHLQLDRNFVGREQLLNDCINCLKAENEQSKMGVILCGLSGMGKTSLAGAICCKLQADQPSWEIVKVNQRGKSEIPELCMDLVKCLCDRQEFNQLPEAHMFQQDVPVKKLLEKAMMILEQSCGRDTGRGLLLWLDDLDGHCSSLPKMEELCRFLQDIVKKLIALQTGNKARLLLTVARKLGREHEPMLYLNQRLGDKLMEIEVPAMKPAETEMILRKFSGLQEKDITTHVCEKLCALCCGSPIAIRSVADMLRDGCDLQDVLGYLKCEFGTDLVINKQLNKCITKSIEGIDIDIGSKEYQSLLVQLSVFQTADFDIDDAFAVTHDSGNEMKEYMKDVMKAKLTVRLIEFKARHLLEMHSHYIKNQKENFFYSIHPLVAKYLTTLIDESKDLRITEEQAKSKFLNYFYHKILNFALKQDKNPVVTKFRIEDKRVHIKHFFELFINDEYCKALSLFDFTLTGHKMSRKSITVQHSRLWKIAQSFLHIEQKRKFAQAQAKYALERRNICGYMYWTCMEIENLIHQDKKELAEQVLDTMIGIIGAQQSSGDRSLENRWPENNMDVSAYDSQTTSGEFRFRVNDWDWPPVEVIPVYATYCVIRGRLLIEKTPLDMALLYLKLAEEMYEGKIPPDLQSIAGKERISKRDFRNERAKVQNLIGVVYFQKGEYEHAREYHGKAYDTIRKELQDNVKWHEDFTEYHANIASTYHQEGLNVSDKSIRNQKFTEALQIYSMCIETDKTMKRDMLHAHACVLSKRAEIYYLQNDIHRAITDQRKVVRIMDSLFRPPNIKITLANEQISRYYFKLGKELRAQHKFEESNQSFETALEYFDDTLSHIVIGGLPINHNNKRTYRIIKEKHLECLEKLGRKRDKFEKKYQKFEEGSYDEEIQRNKLDDFDREELLRKAQEEGTMFELIPCEDSDSDDSTSTSGTSSSTSSGSHERAIERLRRDSGIADYKASSIEEIDPVHNLLASEVFKLPSVPQTFPNKIDQRRPPSIGATAPHTGLYYERSLSDHDLKVIFPNKNLSSSTDTSKSYGEDLSSVEYRQNSGSDNSWPVVRDSGLGSSEESSMDSSMDGRRPLVRQTSVDLPYLKREKSRMETCFTEWSNRPSTSQDFPKVSSVIQHTSRMASRKRSVDMSQEDDPLNSSMTSQKRSIDMSQDDDPLNSSWSADQRRSAWLNTPTGSQSSSAEERRESWASTGSQDSVTSQLRLLKPFTETATIDEEEPSRKKLRKSDAIEEEIE